MHAIAITLLFLGIEAALQHKVGSSAKVFEQMARNIEDAEKLPLDAKGRAALARLKSDTHAKQRLTFPGLRRGYGKIVASAMFTMNVDPKVLGTGARTIIWTATMFADNVNIDGAEKNALEHLLKLRFTKSDYRWMNYADGYSYTLRSPADDAIGYWDSTRFTTVN